MRHQVTVAELIAALKDLPQDAKVELALSQHNSIYAEYIELLKDEYQNVAVKGPSGGGWVRIFGMMPSTDSHNLIIVKRKKQ